MNAEEFAIEFVNELKEDLKNPKFILDKKSFYFSKSVYDEDEDLKVLKKKLNENGFDIVFDSIEHNSKIWKVVKL